MGALGPTGAGQAEPRADAASAWGCVARLVQLNPPVKGLTKRLGPLFLHIFEDQDQVPASQRYPLIR